MQIKRRHIYWFLFLIAIVAIWEYYGRFNINVRLIASSPTLILDYISKNSTNIIKATIITLTESVIGLLIAIIFCFSTMIICIFFPKVLKIILPIFISSQVVPIIALAPLIILIFGIGLNSKIVMASLMCFFPLFMNLLSGINSIPENIKDLTYTYSASTWFKIKSIYFPLSTQHIFTGLKISSTLSIVGAIVAEFNGADYGLGKNLYLAAKRLEPELMMTSLIISILLGSLMYIVVVLFERKFGKWYINN